jgi:hypothetical protein
VMAYGVCGAYMAPFPEGCRWGVARGAMCMAARACWWCICSAESLLRRPFHVALVPHQKMPKTER